MDRADVERAVLDAIDPASLIALVGELVAIPTLSGEEAPGQRFVAERLAAAGADVDTFEVEVREL